MENLTEEKINKDLEEWIEQSENPNKITPEQIEQKRGELRIRAKGGYTVLSIGQLKGFLKKAKERSKKDYNDKIKSHSTIVIHWELAEEEYDSIHDGRIQIGSGMVTR